MPLCSHTVYPPAVKALPPAVISLGPLCQTAHYSVFVSVPLSFFLTLVLGQNVPWQQAHTHNHTILLMSPFLFPLLFSPSLFLSSLECNYQAGGQQVFSHWALISCFCRRNRGVSMLFLWQWGSMCASLWVCTKVRACLSERTKLKECVISVKNIQPSYWCTCVSECVYVYILPGVHLHQKAEINGKSGKQLALTCSLNLTCMKRNPPNQIDTRKRDNCVWPI